MMDGSFGVALEYSLIIHVDRLLAICFICTALCCATLALLIDDALYWSEWIQSLSNREGSGAYYWLLLS